MKKVLKKYELYILGNNELFIYKGQKYKLQRSKKSLQSQILFDVSNLTILTVM